LAYYMCNDGYLKLNNNFSILLSDLYSFYSLIC
jgi:hypothetical protein